MHIAKRERKIIRKLMVVNPYTRPPYMWLGKKVLATRATTRAKNATV
jgi:hypothetical protein